MHGNSSECKLADPAPLEDFFIKAAEHSANNMNGATPCNSPGQEFCRRRKQKSLKAAMLRQRKSAQCSTEACGIWAPAKLHKFKACGEDEAIPSPPAVCESCIPCAEIPHRGYFLFTRYYICAGCPSLHNMRPETSNSNAAEDLPRHFNAVNSAFQAKRARLNRRKCKPIARLFLRVRMPCRD